MAHEEELVVLMDQVSVPLETMHPPPHWSEQELWRNDDPGLLVQLTCCRLASGLSGFKSPAWGQPERRRHRGDHFDEKDRVVVDQQDACRLPPALMHSVHPCANRPPEFDHAGGRVPATETELPKPSRRSGTRVG